MIFALLIALALLFVILGFLLHAIYSRAAVNKKLAAERANLRKKLDEKQKENDGVRDEIARKNALLHNLEQMMGKRNGEIEALQSMALRQEEEINLLRKDAAAIRRAVVESEVAVSSGQGLARGVQNGVEEPQAPQNVLERNHRASDRRGPSDERQPHGASRGKKSEAPGARSGEFSNWRENLSEILKGIDSVEEKKEE
jgi:chromosome segregation ATPase